MRIACPCIGDEMEMNFCHAEHFKIFDVEGSNIINKTEILNNAEGHEEVALLLKDLGVDDVVCALIGEHGVSTLNRIGIEVYAGVKGDLDAIVKAFASNEIELLHNLPTKPHGHGCGHHHHHHDGCCHHDEECGCHDEECDCHHHE